MVARAMVQEVREGRGAGPNSDYVYLDLTHLPAAQIEEKLPDITEFARTYLGVDPISSWCRCSPPRTTRWAASPPTSRPGAARQRPLRARSVRRR